MCVMFYFVFANECLELEAIYTILKGVLNMNLERNIYEEKHKEWQHSISNEISMNKIVRY